MIAELAANAADTWGNLVGDDFFRSTRKNASILAIALLAIALLALGWRNLFMGRGRTLSYLVFVTGIGSLAEMTVGGALIVFVTYYAGGYVLHGNVTALNAIAAVALAGVSGLGVVWGVRDARTRKQRLAIEAANVVFFASIGLRQSPDPGLLEDASGLRLKLIEQTPKRIVFSVRGEIGSRATITIIDGRLSDYTGIVRQTPPVQPEIAASTV